MDSVSFHKLASAVAACSFCWMLGAADIYLAGDSTCADYQEQYRPQQGWGQRLPDFCRNNVRVHNFAAGGRSSKSFRGEGRWRKLLEQAVPGDYVVIQFGHNDQHPQEYRHTDPETTYREYLTLDVREARARNLIPILATPVPTCVFKDGKLTPKLNLPAYRAAMLKVAAAEKVPVVDLYKIVSEKLETVGAERAKSYYMFVKVGEFPNLKLTRDRNDYVHLREAGARMVAETLVDQIKQQRIKMSECFK